MKTKLIACACAVSAAIAFAPLAEAGGGVRLGFGGPLGNFTATPSKSAGSRAPLASRKVHAARPYAARKTKHTQPVREAARRTEAAPIRAPREITRTEPVADAPRVAIAKAHVETEKAALTGSSALLHAAIPDTETGHDAATDEPETGATSDETAESDETESANATAESTETCSKFIPAVGMTVTVECHQ